MIALIIPLTYAVRGIRGSLFEINYSPADFFFAAAPLTLFAGLIIPLRLAMFGWAVHKAKQSGTLSYVSLEIETEMEP